MGIKIATITYLTYIDIPSHYLIPAILTTWNKELLKLKKELGSEALRLGGDAPCCTPGHTAKYGRYSLMDLVRVKVVHFELVSRTFLVFFENIKKCQK